MKRTTAKSTQKRKRTKLRYLLDVTPGYGRIRRGRGYYYTDQEGKRLTDVGKLERCRALVIPPAWKDVWISPSKKGHLQATGIDEQGRKQYLYHPEWTSERQRKKLQRMADFGNALPRIRRQITKDLHHEVLLKEKVTAIALRVIELTLIRIGNEQYFRRYGSHGLTTLKKKHVRISKNNVVFRFRGKKGVGQEITVRDINFATKLMELNKLPGVYLFQYINEEGKRRRLGAADINSYIQHHTGVTFSSKDYRTWYAGFWAFHLFANCYDYADETVCETNIRSVLDAVSHRLGNTRAVCKQYYVPDRLISAYRDGSLFPYLHNSLNSSGLPTTKKTEQQLLDFLKDATTGNVL